MGCGSSSGGCSSGGCSSGGCSSMSVHDWLSNVTMPGDPFNIVEVEFKGGRKSFFRNTDNLMFSTGDDVVIDAGSGHDIGTVSLQGELVRLQMKKKKVKDNDDITVIYRVATDRDLERHKEAKNREMTTMYRAREIIMSLKLKMKLSDVEFQSDNTKATFYYSADDRVDFRALIKNLASEFRIRVEMRQISLRQEAGRVGGIGSCGRELCCTTWMTDFKSVSTSAARYQNLSLNPLKLSGQCGRLKCCLNYELDTYLEELKDIPKVEKPIKTEDGDAFLQKTDIFKKLMWFGYKGDTNWHVVPITRVVELLELNEKGITPHSLQLDETEVVEEVAVNHDLLQLDKKYRSKDKSPKRKPKGKKRPAQRGGVNKVEAKQKPKPKGQQQNRQGNKPKSNAQSQKRNTQNPSNKKEQGNNKGQQQRGTEAKSLKRENQKPQEQKGKRPHHSNKKAKVESPQAKLQQKVNQEARKPRPQRNKVKLQRQGVVDGKQNNEKGAKPKSEEGNAK